MTVRGVGTPDDANAYRSQIEWGGADVVEGLFEVVVNGIVVDWREGGRVGAAG